ncbi:hypothetical protein BLS_002930 [Venturia inaequalis]|uniref:BTB domain-containing protein n=1 Tax=Venturia inaequalis TaxID=5025 RepID=A0A8H3UR08_VENIN|nr:hypothetical protein EG328_000205 [Venturia inaequalis]KAE9966836.1 hypothetical protein EG327_011697 [Venturia inaequalis]KAE9974735.1 hypothetical protein BLS_002930 [Venturia inaequalis]RDI82544.1 hypothetical protein Vi05172_g7590 [Venturia inaequalis]
MPPKAISKTREARIARGKVPVKRPSFDFIAGEAVSLYVGEAAKLHVFHKDLLVNTSLYFRKAFTGHFKEKDGDIVLDDITERAFSVLNTWLYSQKLERPKTLRDKYKVRVRFVKEIDTDGNPIYGRVPLEEFDETTMKASRLAIARTPILYRESRTIYLRGRFEAFDYQTPDFWHWDDLVDVYIMADKYDFPHLRDDIVKQWQYQATNFKSLCTIETVARAFKNLPDKSHLLSLIVVHWAFCWQPRLRDTKAMQTKAPNQFLVRLAVAQADYKGKNNTEFRPQFRKWPCCQHEHLGEDGPCYGYEEWFFGAAALPNELWNQEVVPDEESEYEGSDNDDGDNDDGDGDVDEEVDEAMVIG